MKIYLCVTDTGKRNCRSVTILDSAVNCRELIAFLSFFSYNIRIYEKPYGLKIFVVCPYLSCIDDVTTKKEGERYAKVSNRILGKI